MHAVLEEVVNSVLAAELLDDYEDIKPCDHAVLKDIKTCFVHQGILNINS